MKILAVIAARGGSKRLPRKNILDFNGKPLICWSVEAALGSRYIDTVVVNSDSDEILEICAPAAVKLDKRCNALASDTTPSAEVALDVLNRHPGYDHLIWLQPTCPLRTSEHIDEAIQVSVNNELSTLVSVCKARGHPYWMGKLDSQQCLSNFFKDGLSTKRSQEYGTIYELNGSIYLIDIEYFKKHKSLVTPDSYAFVMDQEVSSDIDTSFDFDVAKMIHAKTKSIENDFV